MAISNLTVSERNGVLVIDSRLIAQQLGLSSEIFEYYTALIWGTSKTHFTLWELLAFWLRIGGYENSSVYWKCDQLIDEFRPYLSVDELNTLCWIAAAVRFDTAWNISGQLSEKAQVHTWFRQNFQEFIPGAKLVNVVARDRKRPDFLVDVNGFVYPVECKLEFGVTGRGQLEGYIKLWKCNQGFAVANKLKCTLPKSIKFIQCTR